MTGMVGYAGKDMGEPGLRIDIVELGGDDEAVHERGPLPAAVGAGEQPGFTPQGNAPARSAALLVRHTRPSCRKSVNTGQRLSI